MTLDTTDLMYAAFLLSIGAAIDRTEACGRYTKVYLTVPEYSLVQNSDKCGRLERLAVRAEDVQELPLIYEQSLIKEVATHYFSLKKRIARFRDDGRRAK